MRKRPGARGFVRCAAALLCLAAGVARAQDDSTCAQPLGTLDQGQAERSIGNFCGVTEDPCGLGGGQAIFSLELDGTQNVDLTCSTNRGTLCIRNADCTQEIGRGSQVLIQNAPSTNLRLVLSDTNMFNDAGDQVCTEGAVVTCDGNWGGAGGQPPTPARVIFADDFESGCHRKWAKGPAVVSCLTAFGAIDSATKVLFPPGGYTTKVAGAHQLDLLTWGDVKLEARLQSLTAKGWKETAYSPADDSETRVVVGRPAGDYRWEVRAVGGSGHYWLGITTPADRADTAVDNKIQVGMREAYRSLWSLENRHVTGSRQKAYLVDADHPEDESRYIASFRIQPDTAFVMARNDTWTLLRADETGARVSETFRIEVQGLKKAKKVRLRAYAGSQVSKPVNIKRGAWTEVVVDYQAASAGAANGWICLSKRGSCAQSRRRSLNSRLLVDRILLGRVAGNDTSPNGSTFLDDFESRRKP